MISFKRLPEDRDNFYRYLWRVGSAIENGTAGCNWEEARREINKEWDKSHTSSAYRKPVQYAIPFYEYVFSQEGNEEQCAKLKEQMDQLYVAKKQLSDQRREYNRILTQKARADHLLDIVKECASKIEREPLEPVEPSYKASNREAILCLSDWHYGMTTDNIWNKFDTEICRQRVRELAGKAIDAFITHKVSTLHVVCCGDFAHGACHVGVRVASEELVCDQLMHVSEMIASLIEVLALTVPHVEVYSTFGNHMRTVQSKADSIHDDNMEKIIPWYLQERFRHNDKVNVNISEYNDIIIFDCCGYGIFATHGDLDKFEKLGTTANMLANKVLGKTVDYTIAGDKHNACEYDSFGVENIQLASLCGTDEFAHNNRLYSHPGQLLMIFNPTEGRECTYNIKFRQTD